MMEYIYNRKEPILQSKYKKLIFGKKYQVKTLNAWSRVVISSDKNITIRTSDLKKYFRTIHEHREFIISEII